MSCFGSAAQTPLQTTLFSAVEVNQVEAEEPSESDPKTPVLKVWLA